MSSAFAKAAEQRGKMMQRKGDVPTKPTEVTNNYRNCDAPWLGFWLGFAATCIVRELIKAGVFA